MSGELIKHADTNRKSYTELKQLAVDAVSYTGVTFNWQYNVVQNDIITAAQVDEIISAVDKAYDAVNTGCTSKDSGYYSSNRGYDSGYYSALSGDKTSNNTSNNSVCSSNLSAQNSSRNYTVNLSV